MYDLLIQNAWIVDGTGKDKYLADIAIKDGKIQKIGALGDASAEKIIDAAERHVTPGFIDPHAHSDMSLLVWPKNEAFTLQGVTTQICGNCGLSAAPIGDEFWEFWCWEYASMNKIHKSLFDPYDFQTPKKEEMLKELKETYGIDVNWKTLGEFMDLAESTGISCNYYPLSGHNHIRNAVMGKEARVANEEELEKMKAILREEMEHGSQGFSTGLDYAPGRFADMAELEALINVALEYGGVYNSHVRGFDPENPAVFNQVYGIAEATELCRRTGVKTNIAHMAPIFRYEPADNPEMDLAVAKATVYELERGWREEGLPIMYDVIANPAMGGSTLPHLAALMRPWVLMCGSLDEFMARLEFEDFVTMIKTQVDEGKGMILSAKMFNPDKLITIATCTEKKFEGKTLAKIMKEEKITHLVDAVLAVLKADPYAGLSLQLADSDACIDILLSSERSMPSSDGFAFDLDTFLDLPYPLHRRPHPNNYCYAVRHLLHYGGPRFEDKVKQMTGIPAAWFNLDKRGTLEEGNWADIVVIDLPNLATNEDPIDPGKAPDGIDYVIVNGVIAAAYKKHTGALAGKVLRNTKRRS